MRKMTIDVEKKHLELHSPDSRMTDHEPIFLLDLGKQLRRGFAMKIEMHPFL